MVSKVKAAPGGRRPLRAYVLCGCTRVDSTCQSSVTRHAPAFPQPPRSNRRGLALAAESGGFARRRQSCEREFKLARRAQSTANIWSPDAMRCRHLAPRRSAPARNAGRARADKDCFPGRTSGIHVPNKSDTSQLSRAWTLPHSQSLAAADRHLGPSSGPPPPPPNASK